MATIRVSKLALVGSAKNVFYLTDDQIETLKILETIILDIKQMRDNGVFDFKGGEAIIHRDIEGTLRKIEIKTTRWLK